MTITLIQRADDTPRHKLNGYLSGTYTAASVTNALLTTTNAEASGFSAGGSTINAHAVIGSGVLTIKPGFVPKRVKVTNVTQRLVKEWFEGMNVTDSLLTIANGTKTLVTTSGVLVSSAAAGGTVPVTTEPVPQVAVTFATDNLVTDNDTIVWEIEG